MWEEIYIVCKNAHSPSNNVGQLWASKKWFVEGHN